VDLGRTDQAVRVISREEFLENLRESGLLSREEILKSVEAAADADGEALARRLAESGKLTYYQVRAIRDRRFSELMIGNYEVLDRLGAGGMGTVYKARHRRMKRVVAIKVLSREVAQAKTFLQRFQREVETVASLSHPHIVMAFDADEAEVGHFLVMEFVDGRDLATEVQARGPLPVDEVIDYIMQAARGLEYAHGKGILHRDVKPANLLRDARGMVKVADLGLARFSNALGKTTEPASSLTQAGGILGTVDFMPPEQALDSTTIDHRADIYSLGCTLFYLLAGHPPYQAENIMQALLKHREAPLPSLRGARPDAPEALEAVFQRMLAKKPPERYGSMTEVLEALAPLATRTGRGSTTGPMHSAIEAPGVGGLAWQANVNTDQLAATLNLPGSAASPAVTAQVLLVEPSRVQSGIIRRYGQQLGIETIVGAATGQEALEKMQSARPQVVISAMHLADMTGVQLAQRIRAAKLENVGFILITTSTDASGSKGLLDAGDVVTLAKPFDLDRLSQALARAGLKLPSATATMMYAGNFKVLIVDDSAVARNHMRSVLAGLGIRNCVEVNDGANAVARLGKERFDLVVTDYHMPGLDGRGLLEFIRGSSPTPELPVIMVTTETDRARLEAVRRLGATAILSKDFDAEIVRGLIEKLLKRN
jgi:CheY-like chemotaxis protein